MPRVQVPAPQEDTSYLSIDPSVFCSTVSNGIKSPDKKWMVRSFNTRNTTDVQNTLPEILDFIEMNRDGEILSIFGKPMA